ncbi:MAG: gliding motility-associated C-terminal domain-containing protein [Bacteroidota bacterium]
MTDNFNIEDFDKIDEIVKNALGNFSETPSSNLWTKMRLKLFKHDLSNLFRFKKSLNPSMNPVTPVFKMVWVQVAAAAVTVAVVSTIIYMAVTPKQNSEIANTDDHNKSINKTPEKTQNSKTFNTDNNTTPEQNTNNLPVINSTHPENRNVVTPQQNTVAPVQKDSKYTENGTPDKSNKNNQPSNNTNPENQNIQDNNNLTDQLPVNQNGNNPSYNNSANQGNQNNNPSVLKVQGGGKPVDTVTQPGPDKNKLQGVAANVEKPIVDELPDQQNENIPGDVIDSINNGQWPGDNTQQNDDHPLIIPNAINPNNDGKNDYFVIPEIELYPVNTLLIFDRGGKIIYQKSDYQNNWSGEGYPGGSYYYVFTYKKKDGTEKVARGSLFIVR